MFHRKKHLSNGGEREAHSSDWNTSNSMEKMDTDTVQELTTKKITTNGSKLSASALPFIPGSLFSLSHPYKSVDIRGYYDARFSQQMMTQPLEIPSTQSVNSRVPCGPRSTLYYRKGHFFPKETSQFKLPEGLYQEEKAYINCHPHAAEFVPAKTREQKYSDATPATQIPASEGNNLNDRTSVVQEDKSGN